MSTRAYKNAKFNGNTKKNYAYTPEYIAHRFTRGGSVKTAYCDHNYVGDVESTFSLKRSPAVYKGASCELVYSPPPEAGPAGVSVDSLNPSAGPTDLALELGSPASGPTDINTSIAEPEFGPVNINVINSVELPNLRGVGAYGFEWDPIDDVDYYRVVVTTQQDPAQRLSSTLPYGRLYYMDIPGDTPKVDYSITNSGYDRVGGTISVPTRHTNVAYGYVKAVFNDGSEIDYHEPNGFLTYVHDQPDPILTFEHLEQIYTNAPYTDVSYSKMTPAGWDLYSSIEVTIYDDLYAYEDPVFTLTNDGGDWRNRYHRVWGPHFSNIESITKTFTIGPRFTPVSNIHYHQDDFDPADVLQDPTIELTTTGPCLTSQCY